MPDTQPVTPDIRRSLTSASNAEADSLCPGRHLAQRGLPSYETSDAAAGTLIHRAFAGEEVEGMNPGQRKTLKQARLLEESIVNDFFGNPEPALEPAEINKRAQREQRLWSSNAGQEVHSAGIDAFWLTPDWSGALIEDLKGLWGQHADAEVNLQLRDEAALLYENFGVQRVVVFINQPNVRWRIDDQKLVTYELEDLEAAHQEMTLRVLKSNDVTSPRKPGPKQCRFCRAAGTSRCPESQAAILGAAKAKFDASTATPAERGEWITTLKALEKMVKKVLSELKTQLQADPTYIEGWEIKAGGATRSIENIWEAGAIFAEAFGEAGFTREQFLACCTLSIPKLEELHDKLSGLTGKASKEQFANLIGHLIEEKAREGSLVESKS